MKMIALIAAAGSLAAITAPASAAEFLPMAGAPTQADSLRNTGHAAHPLGGLDSAAAAHYGGDDRDDDYDDRRYSRGRDYDNRVYDRRGRYREARRLDRRDRIWRARDGNYYCERDNGTTGLVVGAGVGALLGRTVDTRGDRTVGTLLGAVAGGLLGREIDRNELRCR